MYVYIYMWYVYLFILKIWYSQPPWGIGLHSSNKLFRCRSIECTRSNGHVIFAEFPIVWVWPPFPGIATTRICLFVVGDPNLTLHLPKGGVHTRPIVNYQTNCRNSVTNPHVQGIGKKNPISYAEAMAANNAFNNNICNQHLHSSIVSITKNTHLRLHTAETCFRAIFGRSLPFAVLRKSLHDWSTYFVYNIHIYRIRNTYIYIYILPYYHIWTFSPKNAIPFFFSRKTSFLPEWRCPQRKGSRPSKVKSTLLPWSLDASSLPTWEDGSPIFGTKKRSFCRDKKGCVFRKRMGETFPTCFRIFGTFCLKKMNLKCEFVLNQIEPDVFSKKNTFECVVKHDGHEDAPFTP